MRDPITFILNLFGYEHNPKNSLLFGHMMDVTHGNWHYRMFNNGKIEKYKYNLYSIHE
jgi:hypothetical protein